jgi:hypothetical protein
MRLDKTVPPDADEYHLERVFDHALTPGWQDEEPAPEQTAGAQERTGERVPS